MKNFFIIANKTKDGIADFSNIVKSYIESKGAKAVLGDWNAADVSNDTECIIVLGGDGTMLRGVEAFYELGLPFLGINLGTIGYLSAVEKNDMQCAIDQMIAEDYIIEERMMLIGEASSSGEVSIGQALNEVVVTGSRPVQLIALSVYVNGMFLHRYEADGLIVATPTGSTGYSMSAGGPIINPVAQNIILTPICPHAKFSSSIVLSEDDEIVIEVDSECHGAKQDVCAFFDGQKRIELSGNDKVRINKHERFVKIVKLKQESFLETLNIKMQE